VRNRTDPFAIYETFLGFVDISQISTKLGTDRVRGSIQKPSEIAIEERLAAALESFGPLALKYHFVIILKAYMPSLFRGVQGFPAFMAELSWFVLFPLGSFCMSLIFRHNFLHGV